MWGMLLWIWGFVLILNIRITGFLGDPGCFQLELKLKSREERVG